MAVYKNMADFKKKLDKWQKEYPNDMAKYVGIAAESVREEVLSKHLNGRKMPRGVGSSTNATLGRKSGRLHSGISTRVTRIGGKILGWIGNLASPLKYAKIHEYGGIITPKKGKYLVFKIGDKTIFATSVRIPERSYLRSSLKRRKFKIIKILSEGIMESYKNA